MPAAIAYRPTIRLDSLEEAVCAKKWPPELADVRLVNRVLVILDFDLLSTDCRVSKVHSLHRRFSFGIPRLYQHEQPSTNEFICQLSTILS
jgi:hypothetical protein